MATRADNRSSSTVRPISITSSLLSRDGSASFSFGIYIITKFKSFATGYIF